MNVAPIEKNIIISHRDGHIQYKIKKSNYNKNKTFFDIQLKILIDIFFSYNISK